MNYYLPRFVSPIEQSLATVAQALGLATPIEWSPFLGPDARLPLGNPEPVDGRTFKSGDVIEGRHFVNGTWVGLEHRIEAGPCERATLRGLVLEHCSKWGSRSYRMGPGNKVTRCAFVDIKPEHALYWNIRGDGSTSVPTLGVRQSLFLDVESQAVQLVYRAQEQGFDFAAAGDGRPAGDLIVADCLARNVGWGVNDGTARAAFALSFFASPASSVRVVRTIVDKSMQARSSGSLLVQSVPRAYVGASVFLSGETTQPVLQFEGVREVELRTCGVFAEGPHAVVSFQGCERATIAGCRGNVAVVWNGRNVGSIESTHVLESE